MSFMDKAKDALTQAKGKASDLAGQHGDKIDQGISKAGDFVDKKTGGKHADKIDQAQAKARGAADRLSAERRARGETIVGETVADGPTTTTYPADPAGAGDPVVGDPVVTDPAFPADGGTDTYPRPTNP